MMVRFLKVMLLSLVGCATGAYGQPTTYEQGLDKVAKGIGGRLSGSTQKNATVLDFTNLDGMTTQLGRLVTQDLTERLIVGVPGVTWIDRSQRDFILKENKLAADKLMEPSTRKQLGKLLGVDTIIVGTITTVGGETRLQARAIDIETAGVLAAESATLQLPVAMNALADRAVASAPVNAQSGSASAAAASIFRNQVFVARPKSVGIGTRPRYPDVKDASIVLEIENISGEDLWIALTGMSIGPCAVRNTYSHRVSGVSNMIGRPLRNYSAETGRSSLTAMPSGGKTLISAFVRECRDSADVLKAASVAISLELAIDVKGSLQQMSAGIAEAPITSRGIVK